MKSAIILFPGSNRERDAARALQLVTGHAPQIIWHGDSELPQGLDLVVLPGGFSYGDYLRCGAIAGRSPIMGDIIKKAKQGLRVLGICNGFQILLETELLPGVLMRNAQLKFMCKDVFLRVENNQTLFTNRYEKHQVVRFPIAHGEGNYEADEETLKQLEAENRVIFRYATQSGEILASANPNGSVNNIAGIINGKGNVMGLMPHPENLVEPLLGGIDGRALFESLLAA